MFLSSLVSSYIEVFDGFAIQAINLPLAKLMQEESPKLQRHSTSLVLNKMVGFVSLG